MPVDYHPHRGPQLTHKAGTDLVVDPPGRRQVQLGLHTGVGPVGVLSAGAA